jgi:DNA invertase Pin-like site-specific DNA recombinase
MEKTVFDLEKNYLIKDVAIYLRLSRGELENDIENHRLRLTDICKKQKLNFKEFKEIGTSDSIQDRPNFIQMFNEIKEGLFDAIAIMDIDCLGRGDDEDWGKIDKILKEKEILIITPDKIYDLENEEDEFHFDVKKFFARLEYKQITKRLRRGKILEAKRGKWTNGKPPFPYI